jgi:hypothetical protein
MLGVNVKYVYNNSMFFSRIPPVSRWSRAYAKGFSAPDEPPERQTVGRGREGVPPNVQQQTRVNAEQKDEEVGLPSREQVLSACLSTSAILVAVGAALSVALMNFSSTDGDGVFDAANLVGNFSEDNILAMILTAGSVTGARQLLLMSWEEFRSATDAANTQVLVPLRGNFIDIATVGTIPAISEEFLFRFVLIPAISPDWRGAIIAGLVFGVLHMNGGRNAAFAAWASMVGTMYGFLYLHSNSLGICAGAHAMANVVSASIWLASRQGSGSNDARKV